MYKVTFSDDTSLVCINHLNSNWNKIDKAIKSVRLFLKNREFLLENYDAYNHLVIHKYCITTKKEIATDIIFLARKDNVVKRIIFNINSKTLIEDEVEFGKEFNDSATTGWKS